MPIKLLILMRIRKIGMFLGEKLLRESIIFRRILMRVMRRRRVNVVCFLGNLRGNKWGNKWGNK